MPPPTATQRERALRVLTHESGANATTEMIAEAAERICQRLNHRLGAMLGVGGFAALLGRAIGRTAPDFAFIGEINGSGKQQCLGGLHDLLARQHHEVAKAALVTLFATLLALLETLIGEDMSLRVLVDVWVEGSMEVTELRSDAG